ncbi:MAG: heme-degrading domain-containing protein [Spirochaetia bacterium]|nr:heme-degrading domain-containing protein [Spirochaetia bacterium]
MTPQELLETLKEQESAIQFTSFDSTLAYKIGSFVVEHALKNNLPIALDISVGNRCLFHFSANEATLDNEMWIMRKVKSVKRFQHSSYFLGRRLALEGKTMSERYMISEQEYAFHGGCFPIILKGTGAIGTMTISGLAQEDDHQLVVDALTKFLR